MSPLRFVFCISGISDLDKRKGVTTSRARATSSLTIWAEDYVPSVTYFPPTEGSSGEEGWNWRKGESLSVEGVARPACQTQHTEQ